jgi:hypothetical protein
MQVKAALFALAGGDDVGSSIAIEVGEDGILGAADCPDGESGPRVAHLFGSGMKGDSDLAALLPTGDEIEAAVAIEIAGLGAVGAGAVGEGIGGIDGVAGPGLLGEGERAIAKE